MNAKIARCDMCGDENVACKVVWDLTVCVDCYLNYTISTIVSDATAAANARIAELEAKLAANTSNANMFAAVTAADPTTTTRLLYVDLTKDDCFAEFDKPLGDKQVKAIFCPQYSGNDLYA